LRSYLLGRSFTVNFQGECSALFDVVSGVPHGSILGPTFFNVFINDISKSRNTHLVIYVDDTAIYSSSWSMVLLTSRLQKHDDVLQYLSDWKMSIYPEKTEAIIFTCKRMTLPPLIRVNDYSVPWSKMVKYLGTVLDSGLRWDPAVTDRVRWALGTIYSLYPLINRKRYYLWNTKYYCIRCVPSLLYCMLSWFGPWHLSKSRAKNPKQIFTYNTKCSTWRV